MWSDSITTMLLMLPKIFLWPLDIIVDILTTSPESFRGGTAWSTMNTVSTGLQSIAFSLAVLCFFIGFIKSTGDFASAKRPESLAKPFIRLILTNAVIMNSTELLLFIVSLLQVVISKVLSALGTTNLSASMGTLPDEVTEAIDEAGLFTGAAANMLTTLGVIVVISVSFGLVISVYKRLFRVFIYVGAAPIPLAFFAGESTASIGKGFLKSFFAVCFEGVAIILAYVVFMAYMSSDPYTFNFGDGPTAVILCYEPEYIFDVSVFVAAVKACESLANRIVSQG